jgi:glyoxylase-like metal-dependent hydrolase (beta-lactamase superfamily II)
MRAETDGVSQVARGVLRIQKAGVNCYLLHSDDGITLIDAGLPGMWPLLEQALESVRATPDDIAAIVLTHGHFDHVGMAARLRREHDVRVQVHPADQELARHPYRYDHEDPRWPYPFRYPKALPMLLRMTAAGALNVKGVEAEPVVTPGQPVDVPGRPVAIASPGHTAGHCGFFLPDVGVLLTGDALVTLDPYSGRTGPRLVARAATADVAENRRRLSTLAETDARLVLPGHGLPYDRGIRWAVAAAVVERVA